MEAHGRRHHMTLEEIQAAVGDTYASYVQAKTDEMQAREAAYQRVAAHALVANMPTHQRRSRD